MSPSPNLNDEFLTLVPQNVMLFGYKVFIEVTKLKLRSLGWVLIQYDCCPYTEGKWTQTRAHRVMMEVEIRAMHLQAEALQPTDPRREARSRF